MVETQRRAERTFALSKLEKGYEMRKLVTKAMNVLLVLGAVFSIGMLYSLIKMSDRYPSGWLNLYLAIAAVLLLACLVTLALPTRAKATVVLLGVSVAVGCYLAEITVFILYYSDLGAALRTRLHWQNPAPEGVGKLRAVDALRASGLEAYPSFHPCQCLGFGGFVYQGSTLFPLAGVSRKPTVFCTGKHTVTYQSDRYGFNNPDRVWDLEKIDTVLIGDSFAQGSCVEREENVAGHLSQEGCDDVINLGQAGSGPLLELAVLIEYAQHLKPRNLVWFYFEGAYMTRLLRRT